MKQLLAFSISFLMTIFSVFPATITGMVTDTQTGKPLEFASVFIAGTTFGTNTRMDGSFSLSYTPGGSSQLIVAHLGYQTYSITATEIPTDKPLNVTLQVKPQQLSAVSVVGFDANRKANLADFVKGFLGDSEFGKKCTIVNTHVLHLERRRIPGKFLEYELIAFADSDLIIENKLLGYTIRYTLESFYQTDYSTIFKGYPLFLDNLTLSKNQDKTLAYRERAYQGSQMHFFRSLFTKTLQKEGFEIYKVAKEAKSNLVYKNTYGLMADTIFVPEPGTYMVQTEKPLDLYDHLYIVDKSAALQYDQPFEVRFTLNGEDRAYGKNVDYYKGMVRSLGQQCTLAILEGNTVVFFPNGACKDAGTVVTIGYWGFKKVGEILPWDYQPPKTAKQVVTLH